MTEMDDIDEGAMVFRAAAAALRRGVRRRELRGGFPPEFVSLMAEMLSDVAQELEVGSVEGARHIIADVADELGRDNLEDDD